MSRVATSRTWLPWRPVTLDEWGPIHLQVVPLRLRCGYTELARGAEWQWICARFIAACAEEGTPVRRGGAARRPLALTLAASAVTFVPAAVPCRRRALGSGQRLCARQAACGG